MTGFYHCIVILRTRERYVRVKDLFGDEKASKHIISKHIRHRIFLNPCMLLKQVRKSSV